YITGTTVTHSELKICTTSLHKFFFRNIPSRRYRRKPAPAIVPMKTRRPDGSQRTCQYITIQVRKRRATKIRFQGINTTSGRRYRLCSGTRYDERRRRKSSGIDIGGTRINFLERMPRNSIQRKITKFIIVSQNILKQIVSNQSVTVQQSSHSHTIRVVLVVIGMVVGL